MRVALLLAFLILAGCAAPAPPPTDPPNPPALPEPSFELGDPIKVAPTPNNQGEAALTVSPDGQTILTCFHGLFTETSPGYASTDGGATWRRMAFPPQAGPGGDCETAILADGSWAFLASTVAGATILVSKDQGTTWTVNQATAVPINGLADRPWLEAVGTELWLAYMPLNFQPGTVGFTKSIDHGETWTTPVLIGTPSQEEVSVRHGHIVPGNSTVWIPMVRYEPSGTGPRIVQLASTQDGGVTWQIEEVHRSADVIADWPSLALTQAGDLILAVTGRGPGGDASILGLHKERGGDWSEPFLIHDGAPRGASWPWIDGGHGRNATFIVEGASENETQLVWIGRLDAETLTVEQWPVASRAGIEFASVDHDAAGTAYAVYVQRDEAQYFVRGSLKNPD